MALYSNSDMLCLQWSLAAVEQRESASKKAKLAAAELAKLSRRVCGELLDFFFQIFLFPVTV